MKPNQKMQIKACEANKQLKNIRDDALFTENKTNAVCVVVMVCSIYCVTVIFLFQFIKKLKRYMLHYNDLSRIIKG